MNISQLDEWYEAKKEIMFDEPLFITCGATYVAIRVFIVDKISFMMFTIP